MTRFLFGSARAVAAFGAAAALASTLIVAGPLAASAETGAAQPLANERTAPEPPRPTPAQAQTEPGPLSPPVEGRRYLDAAEFRRRYENTTVHLLDQNGHYGSEFYLPGDRTVWIAQQGPCQRGEWAYVAPQFCFTYENGASGPHCWTVFDSEGETYVQSIDTGLILRIYSVDERPLQCDPGLFTQNGAGGVGAAN